LLECPRGGNQTLSNTGDGFPQQTAWTAILEARDPASPERRARLERLAVLYWSPVFNHLRHQWKLSPEDAADLSQEFFLRFLDEDFLRHASPERGRFRTFLRLKLRDLVVDDLRRSSALKRGGGAKIVPLDANAAQEPRWKGLQPDEAFDREWAACLMTESIRALESLLRAGGQGVAFEAFRLCVLQKPPKSYRDCAALLSVKESDVRNYVFKARSALRDEVHRQVRESVNRETEVEEELAYLLRLFEL
jgi:RNA polymerase sigma-70 factor (ECF subfamily)